MRQASLFAALALLVPATAAAGTIRGTARADRIKGTPAADRIDVVGGGADTVGCGAGVDVVTADLTDKIARDCEFVSRRISVDTLVNAAGEHQTELEPSVASDGSRLVAAFQVGRFRDGAAAGIGWSTSSDLGRTWRYGILPSLTTASVPPGAAPRASDPAVAYDAAHATWLVATLVLGPNFTALGISRSPDGVTWSNPVLATTSSSGSLAYDKEWVSCDNTTASAFYGSCYLVYTDLGGGRLALQTSHDGGASWGAAVTASRDAGADAQGALPLVQPSGALTVVFQAGGSGFFAVGSVDGGASFGARVGIAPLVASVQPGLRSPSLPAGAVDPSGRLYVAWADCRFRVGCAGDDIVLSSSVDGTAWSTPTRVPGAGFDSFVPWLAADPQSPGRLGVVTYVRTSNDCALAFCTYGVAVTTTSDGGGTWTKPQRLDAIPPRYTWLADTAGGRFVGDYAAATFAAGRFVPVFALAQPSAKGLLSEAIFAASLP